jgi:hypothetical protein
MWPFKTVVISLENIFKFGPEKSRLMMDERKGTPTMTCSVVSLSRRMQRHTI